MQEMLSSCCCRIPSVNTLCNTIHCWCFTLHFQFISLQWPSSLLMFHRHLVCVHLMFLVIIAFNCVPPSNFSPFPSSPSLSPPSLFSISLLSVLPHPSSLSPCSSLSLLSSSISPCIPSSLSSLPLTPQWVCLNLVETVYFAVQRTTFQERDNVSPVMDLALEVRGVLRLS